MYQMLWRSRVRIKIEKETIDNGFRGLNQEQFPEAIGEEAVFRRLRSEK